MTLIPAWNFFWSVICGAVKVKHQTLPISHCFPLLLYGVLAMEGMSTLLLSFSTHGIWSATNGCTTSQSHQPKSNKQCPTSHWFGTLSSSACNHCPFYLYHHRIWVQILLDAYPISPYSAPLRRQANQQSILLHISKCPPESACLSSTPVVMCDPDLSLELPPSYESHVYDWRGHGAIIRKYLSQCIYGQLSLNSLLSLSNVCPRFGEGSWTLIPRRAVTAHNCLMGPHQQKIIKLW